MARPYSEQFLIEVHKLDADREGVKLAKACIKANLPAHYVADALGVTRMTIYSWFRGKALRDKNTQLVKSFVRILDEDLADGVLPAVNMITAKEYTEAIGSRLSK
jgi:hypothetical protein